MSFYFFTHVLLGLLAGSSANLISKAAAHPLYYPLWLQSSLWAQLGTSISSLCALVAIPTTFVQWGFLWTLATIGELILGAVLSAFVPFTIRLILIPAGPIISIVIIGAFWGFWRI